MTKMLKYNESDTLILHQIVNCYHLSGKVFVKGNIHVKISIMFDFDSITLLSVLFLKKRIKIEPNLLQNSCFM